MPQWQGFYTRSITTGTEGTPQTQLLNAGASLEVVKELMGHRSLDVTLRYTQLYDRTTRAPYDQAMAQVEQRQGLQRRETMDDIRQTALDRFRAFLERRQFSAHTIASYTLDRRLFFREAAGPLAQVSFREVDQFVEGQHQHGRSWATINRRPNALKPFFDCCLDQQLIGGNPGKPSHVVRRGRPLPKALSREQVQRLLAQIDHPLDRALLLVMLRCGLRVSEVAQRKLAQIDWEQPALHIEQGKGRKDRRVYMSPEAVARVQQGLAQHPGERAQGDGLWNRKRHARPLSVKAIHKKMERDATAAGIPASCHRLRQTFASNLLERGAEVIAIRDVLGHSQISSSARDAKVSSQKITQE